MGAPLRRRFYGRSGYGIDAESTSSGRATQNEFPAGQKPIRRTTGPRAHAAARTVLASSSRLPVCVENFIRFDCIRESVGDYGYAALLLSGAVGLTIQVELST